MAAAAATQGTERRQQRRRRAEAGQSLIVAVIVLFLLLVLGAAFIALIANNLRNASQAARGLSADAYAESGIRYLDEQLTTSPDGADWRPAPACYAGATVDVCYDSQGNPTTTDQNDPDWRWIRPYHYDAQSNQYVGGYGRISWGGDTPGSPGGRALVRVTYQPNATAVVGGVTKHFNPGDPNCADPTAAACVDDPGDSEARKYIKLEAIGRVGVINPQDPTTYNNSQALAMARELTAYKQIGLTDYLRYFTNKDNKPSPATLGSAIQEVDLNSTVADGGTFGTAPNLQTVDIPSYYVGGGIRSNAPLTFYGLNKFLLDPTLGEAIEAAGPISLDGTDPAATALPNDNVVANNPARVRVVDLSQAALPQRDVLPSTSPAFNTWGGLIRDNPAGSNTTGLSDISGFKNLRSVPRAPAPIIDTTGADGVTRYRALTRESAPLSTADTGLAAALPAAAGSYGWGQGLYLANTGDVQRPSSLVSLYSLRSDWLNSSAGAASSSYWKGDFEYVPPGITITLTPRYIVLTRTGEQAKEFRDTFQFRQPNGTPITSQRIIRYTYDNNGAMANAPQLGLAADPGGATQPTVKFAGYPARADANGVYNSDFVIYAEGNVRVRGVAGGLDPETQQFFIRHLTIVSDATVYIDGNLLRDNIPAGATGTAAQVKGRSSIALLAKDYIAVNTSQFLAPDNGKLFRTFDSSAGSTFAAELDSGQQRDFEFGISFAGVDSLGTAPPYIGDVSLYLRNAANAASGGGDTANANLLVNNAGATNQPNLFGFSLTDYAQAGNYYIPPQSDPNIYNTLKSVAGDTNTGQAPATFFNDQSFALTQNVSGGTNNGRFLYGTPTSIATLFGANTPFLGTTNRFTLAYDEAAGANPANGTSPSNTSYLLNRLGVAPLDIRIEAILYAQEGSFFIIPGPWFNPDPRDTYAAYAANDPSTSQPNLKRPGDSDDQPSATPPAGTPPPASRTNPNFPFYHQPQDVRITFYGAITENMPAETGDQAAWLDKWGWVPKYQGSRGLPNATGYLGNGRVQTTYHGPGGVLANHVFYIHNDNQGVMVGPAATAAVQAPFGVGGVVYEYDPRASSPYVLNGTQVVPIRFDPSDAGLPAVQRRPLPLTPKLPVAPGLLYVGEQPVQLP